MDKNLIKTFKAGNNGFYRLKYKTYIFGLFPVWKYYYDDFGKYDVKTQKYISNKYPVNFSSEAVLISIFKVNTNSGRSVCKPFIVTTVINNVKSIYKNYLQKRLEDQFLSETLCDIVKPINCNDIQISKWETCINLFKKKKKIFIRPDVILNPEHRFSDEGMSEDMKQFVNDITYRVAPYKK